MNADQRGAASFASAAIAILLIVLAGVGVTVGALSWVQHQVAGAADLAALAGAADRLDGRDACQTAGRTARANGVSLASCQVRGDDIDLVVTVTVQRQVWGFSISAEARAGWLDSDG